jgi:hypothetical protein
VAELCFGKQTAATVAAARTWLHRRVGWSSLDVLDRLAGLVNPRVLVEKSPSTVLSLSPMLRIERNYPDARYLHLVRHPVGQGESIMRLISDVRRYGPVRPWMLRLAGMGDDRDSTTADPTAAWYEQNITIMQFLEGVPAERQLMLRGEDVLAAPATSCRQVADWLGVRRDHAAIDSMLHPEVSPYACLGPPGAPFGNDVSFLRDPALRPRTGQRDCSLHDHLAWGRDATIAPHVRQLAHRLGYR